MIVAMVSVQVMEMPSDQIVSMVCVRNGFLPLVGAHTRHGNTAYRVEWTFGKNVFLVAAFLSRVQMALVEIIDVPFMADARMTALLVVDMRMIRMDRLAHRGPPRFGTSTCLG
jgi:hypothetical protein